jgi:hypothetical protein
MIMFGTRPQLSFLEFSKSPSSFATDAVLPSPVHMGDILATRVPSPACCSSPLDRQTQISASDRHILRLRGLSKRCQLSDLADLLVQQHDLISRMKNDDTAHSQWSTRPMRLPDQRIRHWHQPPIATAPTERRLPSIAGLHLATFPWPNSVKTRHAVATSCT